MSHLRGDKSALEIRGEMEVNGGDSRNFCASRNFTSSIQPLHRDRMCVRDTTSTTDSPERGGAADHRQPNARKPITSCFPSVPAKKGQTRYPCKAQVPCLKKRTITSYRPPGQL